jgi:hypothetical protein
MQSEEDKIRNFSIKLLANDAVKLNNMLTAKVNKITREAIHKVASSHRGYELLSVQDGAAPRKEP